ncbi:MAG: hypothetical protein J0H75_00250, partial [Rhizobiales bacterium]|nr:hypothetical protein [Hyphomicrobiales bacterium]
IGTGEDRQQMRRRALGHDRSDRTIERRAVLARREEHATAAKTLSRKRNVPPFQAAHAIILGWV